MSQKSPRPGGSWEQAGPHSPMLQAGLVGWLVGAGGCSCLKVSRAGQGQHWFTQRAGFRSFVLRASRAELLANLSHPVPSCPCWCQLSPSTEESPRAASASSCVLPIQRREDGAWGCCLAGCCAGAGACAGNGACAGAWSVPELVRHSKETRRLLSCWVAQLGSPWPPPCSLLAAPSPSLGDRRSPECSWSGRWEPGPQGAQGYGVPCSAWARQAALLHPPGSWPREAWGGGSCRTTMSQPFLWPPVLMPRFPSGSRHCHTATGSNHHRERLPCPGSLCRGELSWPRPRGRGELAACDTLDKPLTKRGAKSARLFWGRREVCETFGRDLPAGRCVTAAVRLGLFQETHGAVGASRTLDSAAGCSTAAA